MAVPIPSACRYCGIPEREHFQRWVSPSNGGPGWHWHTPPANALILARMQARRAARTNTTTGGPR